MCTCRSVCIKYVCFCVHKKEGENNDKFFTHPRNAKALAAYLFAHNHLFYMMELLTGLLLMMLSLCEAPAVPSLRLDVYVSGYTHVRTQAWRLAVRERLVPVGPRHSGAAGFGYGGVRAMHETAMAWLPHLHPTQEDHGEGNTYTVRTFLIGSKIRDSPPLRAPVQTCVLMLQFVEAIVVLIRQTSHMRVTRALRPIFLVDCRYCGAVRRYKFAVWFEATSKCADFCDVCPERLQEGVSLRVLTMTVFHPIRNLRQIFQSLPPFIDILLLLLFFMVIFAILGKKTAYLKVDRYYMLVPFFWKWLSSLIKE